MSYSKCEKNEFRLCADGIDEISKNLAEFLQNMDLSSKEVTRLRLCVEEILSIWSEELGEDAPCRLLVQKQFGRTSLLLQADGKSVDPTRYQDELMLSVSSKPNIAAALGLAIVYRYIGGRNELSIKVPKKKTSTIRQVQFAIVVPVILGLLLRLFAPEASAVIAVHLIVPLMDTITRMLQLIAGPLVFLSIISGITGVGDVASFGKIGKTLVKRFCLMTVIITVLCWLSVCWLFPITLSNSQAGEQAVSSLFNMILDIIPHDIVTPFQTGNALQIIFVAGAVGVGSVLLVDSVSETVNLLNQVNAIVMLLMTGISKLLPAYVFLCVSNLMLTSDLGQVYQVIVPLLLIVCISLLTVLFNGLYASIKVRIPFFQLLKAQLPTIALAITTASSAAAFGENVECCTKKLHIDEKLVRFGVPFGQVLYMPGAVILFSILALYMAKQYSVTITPVWIITMIIVVSVLAIASPPIPGGGLAGMMIMFTQLGIPTNNMGLCTMILIFSDYFATSCSIACLQQELLIDAKILDLLQKQEL